MDINRTRKRTNAQPQAVDGFFVNHSGATMRPTARTAAPQGRSVDNFNRADGFYNAPRRNMGNAAFNSDIRPQRTQQVKRAPNGTNSLPGVPPTDHAAPHSLRKPHSTNAPAAGALAGQFTQTKKSSKQSHTHAAKSRSKARSIFIWTRRTVIVGMVLLLVVGGALFGKGYFKLKKVFNGSSSAAALETDVDPSLLKGEGDGRVNILLMGVGGADHDGGDLTDTLIIASVDPINNQAVLFGIPRDLWVKMPNNYIANYQKINAAYESGKYKYLNKIDMSNANAKSIQAGFDSADSTIERVMGVPIHYNAVVNFQAFKQAITTVGGVTVNAPEKLYDPTMAWENNNNPLLASAGVNNFNGQQALNYVRSRETTSDFARSTRQRLVMLALKDKVVNANTLANPLKISNLLSAFGDNVKTDISLQDMTRLASIMKKIPSDQIQSVGLADEGHSLVTTGNINGISIVQPKAGLEDYSEIQTYIRSKLKDGYIAKENARITVLNGTVTPGLATEKGAELKSYGYNIGTLNNAPTTDFTTTQIIDMSKGNKKYTLNYLKKRFNVTSTANTLPAGIVQGDADIVIILGQDASITTQN